MPKQSEQPDRLPPPPVLYRFRSFGAKQAAGQDETNVYDLLLGRVRFSTLVDFNDPFEGHPAFRPAFADDSRQRAAVEQYLRQTFARHGMTSVDAERKMRADSAGKSARQLSEWLGELTQRTLTSNELLILCLSAEPAIASPLTWAHYADSHRGVAIHFDTRHPPFVLAHKIRYSKKYPTIIVPRDQTTAWSIVEAGLLTKSTVWSEEQEWRILRSITQVRNRNPSVGKLGVEWDGQTAVIDRRAIVGITLGARMADGSKTKLLAWLKDRRPDIEIWQAQLHPARYRIERQRIWPAQGFAPTVDR